MDDFDRSDPLREWEERKRRAREAVEEGGGGESEGFELAEAELIEHTSHGDQHSTGVIMRDAAGDDALEVDEELYAEPDEEHKAD